MRILMTGGGTAGSLAPLLATATAMRSAHPDWTVHFLITPSEAERALVRSNSFSFTELRSGKWRRYADWRNGTDLLLTAAAFLRAVWLLLRMKPDLVASAGSFVAVPVFWAAAVLRIKRAVHQQDVELGLANRLIAPLATLVTVALEQSQHHFARRRMVRWTGNPVRFAAHSYDAAHGRERVGVQPQVPVVLIIGGSSGAQFFNTLVAQSRHELERLAHVVHLTGMQHAMIPQNSRYTPLQFLTNDMGDIVSAADVVISRAGFSTLSELAYFGKAVIVIPMPDTHQQANAQYFARHDAAILLNQQTLKPPYFVTQIAQLLQDPARRAALGERMRQLIKPDATQQLLHAYEDLLNHA